MRYGVQKAISRVNIITRTYIYVPCNTLPSYVGRGGIEINYNQTSIEHAKIVEGFVCFATFRVNYTRTSLSSGTNGFFLRIYRKKIYTFVAHTTCYV